MGERKVMTSSKSSKSHSTRTRNMATPSPGAASLRSSCTGATIVRCPSATLNRLRQLHKAEIITLFTPFVPHPPSTALARNMDPFEPLGRALRRQVRHVPYRLDSGMTETHTDFLPTSGAILIVICSTENIISYNSQAFDQQVKFARSIAKKVEENRSLADAPVVSLLITNGATSQIHEHELKDFPALVSCDNYSPDALEAMVRLIFGA